LCDDSGADDLEVTAKYPFFVKTMERVNYDTGEREWNPGALKIPKHFFNRNMKSFELLLCMLTTRAFPFTLTY
jgi:hypothetical protein